MKSELNNLWYSYLQETTIMRTNEEKILIENFLNVEKDFLSTLSSEQKSKFNTYDDTLSKINNISEKNAFIKGVVFATRFLAETLYD